MMICSLKCAILDRSTKDSRQRKRREEDPEFVPVPRDLMGFVIGTNGSSITEIEKESKAKLNKDSKQSGFLVSGNKEHRARAIELVQQKVVSANLVHPSWIVKRPTLPFCVNLTKRATLEGSII